MSNHSDPISPIDHDTLDDVTGACTPAKPAPVPAQPGCHGTGAGTGCGSRISANDRNGWPFSFQQQQQGAQPQQFDVRSWMSNFMRRFRY